MPEPPASPVIHLPPSSSSPTNPQPPLLSGSHILIHCIPALINLTPGTRQQEIAPMLQDPLKLFRSINPNPVYLALFFPSHRSHNKGCCSKYRPLPQAVTDPGSPCMAPVGWNTPSSRKLWVIYCLLHGLGLLICSFYSILDFLLIHYILKILIIGDKLGGRF